MGHANGRAAGWRRTRVPRLFESFLERRPWDHNEHFHTWILANLPPRRERALDVGCGRGELLAALSPHVTTALGVDTDATMRESARSRTAALQNVDVVAGPWDGVEGAFDVVTMVAVLHHLDGRASLRAASRLLAPGGRLLVVGLARPESALDWVWEAASVLANPVIGVWKNPRAAGETPEVAVMPRAEPRESLAQIREVLAAELPGAQLRRRIPFRYTVMWQKPGQSIF